MLFKMVMVFLTALFAYLSFQFFVLGRFEPTPKRVKKACKIISIIAFPSFFASIILAVLTNIEIFFTLTLIIALILVVAISGYFDIFFLFLPANIPVLKKPGKARGWKFWFYLIVWLIVNGILILNVITFLFH